MKRKPLSEFGRMVDDKLIKLNMTKKELAQRIGTSEVYLSMILHGERAGHKYISEILNIINENDN